MDPDFDSGLIERCRKAWDKPLNTLTNKELATLLQQNIAIEHILPIAEQRLDEGVDDDTEWYGGELAEAIKRAKGLQ